MTRLQAFKELLNLFWSYLNACLGELSTFLVHLTLEDVKRYLRILIRKLIIYSILFLILYYASILDFCSWVIFERDVEAIERELRGSAEIIDINPTAEQLAMWKESNEIQEMGMREKAEYCFVYWASKYVTLVMLKAVVPVLLSAAGSAAGSAAVSVLAPVAVPVVIGVCYSSYFIL